MSEILINIDVPDLSAGQAFYTDGLGFELVRVLGGHVAEMRMKNFRVYLLAKSEGTPPFNNARFLRDYSRHWTPVHLDMSVAEITSATQRALKAGAILESGPTSHAWGTIAELSDPFGNGFCLIEFTEEGYDAVNT